MGEYTEVGASAGSKAAAAAGPAARAAGNGRGGGVAGAAGAAVAAVAAGTAGSSGAAGAAALAGAGLVRPQGAAATPTLRDREVGMLHRANSVKFVAQMLIRNGDADPNARLGDAVMSAAARAPLHSLPVHSRVVEASDMSRLLKLPEDHPKVIRNTTGGRTAIIFECNWPRPGDRTGEVRCSCCHRKGGHARSVSMHVLGKLLPDGAWQPAARRLQHTQLLHCWL